jgi:lysophospholipase L1-like esterase
MIVANRKYVRIGLLLFLWITIALAASHRSESPVLLGRYSWIYAIWLGVLIASTCTLPFARATWGSKIWRGRREIFLTGGSLLFAIGVTELGIRASDLYGISYYEYVSDYMRDMESDPDLINRHKPFLEKRYGNTLVSYNERGLRDRSILPKSADELRILALGDSITFGWGVPQDQIFTFKLEQSLQNRLGRNVRVINSGVGGYNTVQELAYFKREGLAYDPNLVILTYVENDIDRTPRRVRIGEPVPHQSPAEMVITWLQKLWLYRLTHHVYRYGWEHLQERPPTRDQSGQGWTDSMSAIDELVKICETRNIPLVVFYYRLKPDAENRLFQDVVRHAKKFVVKDIGQWFGGEEPSALLISKVDSHPNAYAHQLMADHMAVEITNCLSTGLLLRQVDRFLTGPQARNDGPE